MTRASVIIPAWNGRHYLPACLDALLAQDGPPPEIIVVDNASTDYSADLVREHYPQVHLIENERNLGFAGGCNTGLRVAQGELLFILNQDVALRDRCVVQMSEALTDRSVGVVGCKLVYPDGRTIQHAGGVLCWPRAVPNHRGYGEPDDGSWDEPADVDYVTGAAWGFRRDTLERVGELDEGYWPGYFEEVDYCARVRRLGLLVLYVPSAVASHVESVALGKGSVAYLRAFHRGRLRFVLKTLPLEQIPLDFVPAEMAWLQHGPARTELLIMASVYRTTLLVAPAIFVERCGCGPTALARLQEVTARLLDLHVLAWGRVGGLTARQQEGETVETGFT